MRITRIINGCTLEVNHTIQDKITVRIAGNVSQQIAEYFLMWIAEQEGNFKVRQKVTPKFFLRETIVDLVIVKVKQKENVTR